MSKSARKRLNKRKKEQNAFTEMVAIREGALEPPNPDIGGDAFKFDNERDPDKDDERGTLVITIDDDLRSSSSPSRQTF